MISVKGQPVTIHPRKRRASGFTMVELLVGMVVGLIATVVMFQVFAVSEGQKRTTTGAGDAQQNGVGAVFMIERDARMAGFGMSYGPMLGCWVNGYNETRNTEFSFRMAPFNIVDGGFTPDTLTIAYGDSRNFTSPVKLKQDMPDGGADFQVYSRYGFAAGDLFLAVEDNQPCTMYQVLSSTPDTINHNPGNFVDASGLARKTEYNRTGGNRIVMPAPVPSPGVQLYKQWNLSSRRGGRLLNLGQKPKIITYALQGDQLVVRDIMDPVDPGTVIAEGIVQFQVQYAYDHDNNKSIAPTAKYSAVLNTGMPFDQWVDKLPANPTTAMWQQIIGIRFAIVSRSMTPERADTSGNCTATTAYPKWVAAGIDLDISADPNWKCYRYRVFEVTVPARNLMWAPDENA
jgi:type IV pilus assembly protein PilW